MKTAFKAIGVIVTLIAFTWIVSAIELGSFAFWAPRQENVKRNVFEHTQSYVDGKIQDLASYKEQYEKAKDPQDKQIIQNVVRDRYTNFDATTMDNVPELRQFLVQMRGY
jgi:hypothetical protein